MSTALPKIDQAGKPAGVAGQSRDDLDLFTAPGTEIVLADAGVGATTWQWAILDQPPGAAASLTTPNAMTTALTNATVRGSYFVQLVVDGGALPAQVYRIIAGVQIDTPSWVTPPINRPLRIPAKGETTEFNVESAPGAGVNARGWAQELDHWFRAIADFGFGFRAQVGGVPIGPESFYTLNFNGLTVLDAGGGVLDVTGLSSAGVELRNESGPVIPGGPWSQIAMRAVGVVDYAQVNTDANAYVQAGVGEAELIVTNWHHQRYFHTAGIYAEVLKTALACTVQTAPNPMTLEFAALQPGDIATSQGAEFFESNVPAPLAYVEPATASKELRLLYLGTVAGIPAVRSRTVAVVDTPAIPIVVTDVHRDMPDGTMAITLASGVLQLGGGPVTEFQSSTFVRVYDPTGVFWVELFCTGAPIDGAENWTFAASELRRTDLCQLALMPYWDDSGVSTWGVDLHGVQVFIDMRQFGSIGVENLQETALKRIDAIGGDMGWLAGVVFTHEDSQYGGDAYMDSFGLVPAAAGTPFPIQESVEVRGGTCWARGRRYVVREAATIASFGYADIAVCIAARLLPHGEAVLHAFTVASGNPIEAVQRCLTDAKDAPYDPSSLRDVSVPLWFGRVNVAGTALLVDGLVDLRRDVAHHGDWTVAGRSPVLATFAAQGMSYQSRLGVMLPSEWQVSGKTLGEFGCLAAALAWHGAVTGSDNLTPRGLLMDGQSNPAATVRIVGDTLETFPIHLRNNITVEGAGNPLVFVSPSQWWVNHGIAAYAWAFLSIGDPHTTQRFVYNVTLKNFSVVMTEYNSAVHGTTLGAINVWAGDYDSTVSPPGWRVEGTTQDVLLDGIGFDLLDVSAVQATDFLSAIRCEDVSGPHDGGTFNGVTVRGCYTPLLAARISPPARAVNIGVHLHLANAVVHERLTVDRCRFSVNVTGMLSNGPVTFLQEISVRDSHFEVTQAADFGGGLEAFGMFFSPGAVADLVVRGNSFRLAPPVLATPVLTCPIRMDCQLSAAQIESNTAFDNTGMALGSAAIYLRASGSFDRVYIRNNIMTTMSYGILLGPVVAGTVNRELEVTGNTVTCWNFAAVASRGVVVASTGVTTYEFVRIEDNTIRQFVMGIYVSPNRMSNLLVQGNIVEASTAFAAAFGVDVRLTGTSNELLVTGNSVKQVRVGVFVETLAATRGLRVNSNTIVGQALFTDSGNYNGRGVHVRMQHATSDVEVNGNLIRSVHAMSSLDTLQGGGIVIENLTGDFVQHVQINGNNVMLHAEEAPLSAVDFTELSGVAVLGQFQQIQINSNLIANRALRINAAASHGGIFVEQPVYFAAAPAVSYQIDGNQVTWCDASFADGLELSAAGVLVDVDQFCFGVQVTNNVINVQSIYDAGAIFTGAVHGILVGPQYGSPSELRIQGNHIQAWHTVDSEPWGVSGCAVWVVGPITTASIDGNSISGMYRKTAVGAVCHAWGVISACVFGDRDSVVDQLKIDNNVLLVFDGDGLAGGPQNVSYGIRVGALALGVGSFNRVSISGNSLNVRLDGTGSSFQAAIATLATLITGEACGRHLQVSANHVTRDKTAASLSAIDGVLNFGFAESHFSDNVVPWAALGNELREVAPLVGAVASTIWTNNRAGDFVNNGLISLASPPYVPFSGGNNWNGLAFS